MKQSIDIPKAASSNSPVELPHSFYVIGILIPGMGGFFVILGWIFQIEILTHVSSEFVAMKPITAVSFIIASISIFLFYRSRDREIQKAEKIVLAGLLSLLAFLASNTFWMDSDLGITQLIAILNPTILISNEVVKMSPVTGSCFLLLAGTLALRIFSSRKKITILISDLMALAGVVVSIVLGFGYLLGIDHIYRYSPTSSIAVHSLLFFMSCFFTSLLVKNHLGFARFLLSPLTGSVAARRLFPSILLTGLGLTWIRWKAQQAGLFGTEVGVVFSLTAFVVCVSFVLWVSLNSLNATEYENNILQTERNRLYELPNHLLCILDENACFRSVNQGFTEVLGYKPSEMIGRPIWDFIHPEDRNKSADMEQRGRTTVIHSFENRYRAKNGTYKWLRWTGTVMDGINYGAAIDVSTEKEKETELQNAFTSMQQLSFRLHQAQEEERTRISREIHDELGQSLAVLKMEMHSFMKHFSGDSVIYQGFRRMLASIDGLVQSVRTVVAELRPTALEDLGLLAAADWWLEGVRRRTGLEISVQMDIFEDPMNVEQQTAIFRILQEAVTNALKHSKTTRMNVQITERNGILNLLVRDFGQGMTSDDMSKITSTGILGMKERLRPFWGDVAIHNAEGGGVQVHVRMPLREGVRL